MRRTLSPNLYYTGLANKALIRGKAGEAKLFTLSRDFRVSVEVEIAMEGSSWFVIEVPES